MRTKRRIRFIIKKTSFLYSEKIINWHVSWWSFAYWFRHLRHYVELYLYRNLLIITIVPLTQMAVPDYSPLAQALLKLVAIFAVGVLCSYGYNRIMVNVGQGTMKKLRTEMFTNMESLPIR